MDSISLVFDSCVEIFEINISKATRNVTSPWIKRGNINNVFIGFKILEPGDGILGQIVYSAPNKSNPQRTGIVEGFGIIGSDVKIKTSSILKRFLRGTLIFLLSLSAPIILIGGTGVLIVTILEKLIKNDKKRERIKVVVDVVVATLFLGFIGFVLTSTTFSEMKKDYSKIEKILINK